MAQDFYDPSDPLNTRRPSAVPDFTAGGGLGRTYRPGIDGPPPFAREQPGSAIERYYDRMLQLTPTQSQQGLSDLASILGGFSSGEKANRVVQGNFQGDYDRMMMDREMGQNNLGLQSQSDYDKLMMAARAEQRDSEGDALRKLQIGQYLAGGGSDYKPMTSTPALNYKNINVPAMPIAQTSGIAPRAATDVERQAGGDLSTKMMGRLQEPAYQPTKFQPNFGYQPMDPSKYAKPGIMEKIGSYGGLITGGLGALDMLRGGGAAGAAGGGAGVGGMLAGLGGKLGAAGSAIGSGLGSAGSAIGGLLAGSGPALPLVGAGLGAYFLGKKLFDNGPSKEELAGRSAAAQGRQSLTAGATPEQRQQAAGAGWENPDAALLRVVLRDRLGNDEQAAQLVDQLFKAEKMGPGAVQQILAQLG